MNQDSFLKSAMIGGVALGVLSALPVLGAVNCLCCAWVIGGGMLAAHLYVKDSPMPVTLGTGVLLGLLAGAIGAVVDTLFTIPLHMALRGSAVMTEQLKEWADELPNLPTEYREMLRSVASGGPALGSFLFVVTAFFKLVVYGIVAMLGGALGVAVFEKRKIGTPGPDVRPPYEPPPAGPVSPLPPPPPPPADPGAGI
jgi:hypothetical protein